MPTPSAIPQAGRPPIPPLLSVFLDLTRVALSLLVAAGHWTQSHFQDSWPDLSAYAVAAVGGFFVLSGFTIRMLYPSRQDFPFGRYVVERWSRLLSVVIPALLLTVALDVVSAHVNPRYYQENWGTYADHPLRRLLVNLFGVSQVWGSDVSPLSNSPFWSIGYEAGFYLVYGLWLSGRTTLSLVSLILLGPQIALMLALWLLGVVAYDQYCAYRTTPLPGRGARLSGTLLAAGLVAAALVALFGAKTRAVLGSSFGINLRRAGQLSLMEGTLIFFAFFVVVLQVTARISIQPTPRAQAMIRRLGNMTFPIYLFHFPIFVFLGALALYDRHSAWQKALAFLFTLSVIALATPLTDRLKLRLRGAMSWAVARIAWVP